VWEDTDMARVLTTAAGSDIGIGAIQSLHQSSHETIAVDMNPHGAGLYLADHGTPVPPAVDEEWPEAMSKVVKEYDVDVVIPLIDNELQELGRLQSALSEDIPVIVPRKELIEKTVDKKEMYEYFNQNGLRVPETSIVDTSEGLSEFQNNEFPKIVKPRYGQGGEGVQVVHTLKELREYIANTEIDENNLLLQEFIKGSEYTSNVTVTKDNRLLSIVTKEVPERDGYTALGITRDNQTVREACKDAFDTLEPMGPMNVQHMVDHDDTPYLIEINPRFSGSSCLTVQAGVNEFDLLVRDALGENVKVADGYETGLCIIRYTDQIYIDESDLLSRNQ
jgi:carbamoyl-phosphate synthase large subunit